MREFAIYEKGAGFAVGRGEILLTVILTAVFVCGVTLRGYQIRRAELNPVITTDPELASSGGESLNEPLSADSAPGVSSADRRAKPEFTNPGLRDINTAGAEDLTGVRGIGEVLSQNILSHRAKHGPYRQMDDLLEIPGIGPTRLVALKEQFEVKESARLSTDPPRADSLRGMAFPLPGLLDPEEAWCEPRETGAAPGRSRVDINRATLKELEALPRVGPVLAQRIVQDRLKNGPFQCPEDLVRVEGIGPSTVSEIRELITAGP